MADLSTTTSRASNSWKVTYSDLLTGLLAFFLLLIIKAEQDAKTTFKFADQMKDQIYHRVVMEKEQKGLDWLYVEHAGPKGIKILIPSEIGDQTFFQSGEDRIVTNFYFFLRNISTIITGLELEKIPTRHADVIRKLNSTGKDIRVAVRIEGHSDAVPLGRNSRFRDNWDLSTARAHTVAQFFIRETPVPESFFSISGYGPFHPLVDVRNYDENRRVEIYLDVQLVEYENGSS